MTELLRNHDEWNMYKWSIVSLGLYTLSFWGNDWPNFVADSRFTIFKVKSNVKIRKIWILHFKEKLVFLKLFAQIHYALNSKPLERMKRVDRFLRPYYHRVGSLKLPFPHIETTVYRRSRWSDPYIRRFLSPVLRSYPYVLNLFSNLRGHQHNSFFFISNSQMSSPFT